jgi:hypothetical protein
VVTLVGKRRAVAHLRDGFGMCERQYPVQLPHRAKWVKSSWESAHHKMKEGLWPQQMGVLGYHFSKPARLAR